MASIDWTIKTLSECTSWLSGGTPSKSISKYWDGDIPWVSAKDMKAFRLYDTEDHITALGASNGTRIAPRDSILILVRGMTLHDDIPICVPMTEMAFNQDVKAIIPDQTIDRDFLAYWLLARKPYLLDLVDAASHGTGRIGTEALKGIEIALPPLPIQRRIAHILGTLDDKIELNRRMNATLEAMARALFKSWFVDFDPVRAKADGRAPAGMSAETAALFPDSFEDSPLGKVPQGWNVLPLSEHLEAEKGLSYKGSGLADSGMPLHNLNSVLEGGGYKYSGIKYYNGDYKPRHLLQPGDVIVSNTEQTFDFLLIGFPAIVPACFGRQGLFTHHIYRVRPRSNAPIGTYFIFQLLMSPQVRDQIVGYTNGTTVNMLPLDGLQRPLFVMPSAKLTALYEHIVKPAFIRQEHNEEKSRTLAQLRDILLPRLLSGKMQIAEAETIADSLL